MALSLVLFGTIGSTLTCLILLSFAVFLILLVLVQRGKGGGLSGAFGGMGGQSAFGAKAGDTFTRITVVTATLWILVCIISAKYLGISSTSRFEASANDNPAATTPAEPAGPGVLGEVGASDDILGTKESGDGEDTAPDQSVVPTGSDEN